jgi:tetratricopeptide (TPR) repeat protein
LEGEYLLALEFYDDALNGIDADRSTAFYLEAQQHRIAVHKELGHYKDAIKEYEAMIQIASTRGSGGHGIAALKFKRELGLTRRNNGDISEGLKLLQQVYETSRNTASLGLNNPFTLSTLHDIGVTLQDQGKYDGALKNLEKAWEAQREALGENHPSTVDTIHSMGSVYEDKDCYEKAMEWNDKVLKAYNSSHKVSATHPWILYTQSRKANILVRLGRFNEAYALYTTVDKGFEKLGIMAVGAYPICIDLSRVLRDKGNTQSH